MQLALVIVLSVAQCASSIFWSPDGEAGQLPEFKFLQPESYLQDKVNAFEVMEDEEAEADKVQIKAKEAKINALQNKFLAKVDRDTKKEFQTLQLKHQEGDETPSFSMVHELERGENGYHSVLKKFRETGQA